MTRPAPRFCEVFFEVYSPLRTPDQALRVLDDGIDLVALGRVLLFEDQRAEKVRAGKPMEIKTHILTVEGIDQLNVPAKMKQSLRRFFPDRIERPPNIEPE